MKIHINDFLYPSLGDTLLSQIGLVKSRCHLVLLNSPSLPIKLLPTLWPLSTFKICADGGANRLYHGMAGSKWQSTFIPNYIVGDLDSLESKVADFYRTEGCNIVQQYDQDINDLDKSLLQMHSETSKGPHQQLSNTILILGGLGGRFDQEMASFHSLFRWKDKFDRLVLVDDQSTTVLLQPNETHRIIPLSQADKIREGSYCGLIPLAGTVREVHSKGLQWDLKGQSLSFGQLVSTSNTIPLGNEVEINTSDPLVWTCLYEIS